MTVSSTAVSSGPFVPDGVTTTFPVSHPTISSTEIEVRIDDAVISPLLYTFERDEDGTGEVIFTVAPTGAELIIYSKPNFLQPTAFDRFAPMYPDQLNPPLDAAAIRDNYLHDLILQIPEIVIADEIIQAETARLDAENARDAAALSEQNAGIHETSTGLYAAAAEAFSLGDLFDTAAEGLTNGVVNTANLVGGAGGTDGTFAIGFSGGGGSGAAGTFVVSGGAITQITITKPGRNYTSAPAMSFTASAGLSGASASAVIGQLAPDGAYYLVKGAGDAYATLYRNVGGVATDQGLVIPSLSYVDGILAEADALLDAGVADVVAARQEVLNVALIGRPSQGWIRPNDYPDINGDYRNDYGVEFYSDGYKVHPMLPDDATATPAAWRTGLRIYHPTLAAWYVSVRMGDVYDPILSATPITYYVNGTTGNDTTGDGSSGTPWKTVQKAFTTINASGSSVFEIRVSTSTYFGNSGGFDTGNYTLAAGKKVTIVGQDVGGAKPWYLPLQRQSYTKATFAWSDMGNGIWRSTVAVGTISQAAKDTPIVADLSVLDDDGCPTFSRWLAGPYADEAAILAAMAAAGPSFHTTGTTQYVKLASGAEPDPGVNFAYAELAGGNSFLLGDGCRLCIRNFRCVFNARTASGPTPWAFRPTTVTLGSAQPNPFYDIQVSLCDLEAYGFSGNAWQFHDIERAVVSRCKDAFTHLDGPTMSTFYTYPANSNSPEEGLYLHMFVEDHVSRFHGLNGMFRNQPTANLSANGLTGHSRSFTTAINGRFEASNGSNAGFVTGAKALLIACNFTDAKYVAPATAIRQANYLAHGAATIDPTDGTTIWAIYCTGAISPTGYQFHVEGAAAQIVAVDFRGVVTKSLVSGGTLVDGYGTAL